MVFSSITFLFYFLPVFLGLYFFSRYRNVVLLVASLVFYAWGEVAFSFVLIGSILINYVFGLLIAYTRHERLALGAGIALNVLILIIFKYLNLIVDSINPLLMWTGISPIQLAPVHLPLGISFFTFQAMSYLVDVYRKEADAEKNPLTVALYISMFPQLIAGPIVRFHTIADALHDRQEDGMKFYAGIRYFIVGLSQKVLIANFVAVIADQIFAIPVSELNFSLSWLAALSYTLQIYYDFAGYSNMAIGLGLMLGFNLPENFNYPYISQSITEFWRRWHITLSQWFRDYLYIPLGGNRKGSVRLYINLLIVFLICGLWHGASWTFVVWGLYHGLFLVLERTFLKTGLEKAPRPFRHLYAMLVIVFGWVLFRSDSFLEAAYFFKAMIGLGTGNGQIYSITQFLVPDKMIAFGLGALLSAPVWEYLKSKWQVRQYDLTQARSSWYSDAVTNFGLIVAFGLVMMCLASGAYNPFIYFRF